jgi:thioredoxin 1
MGKLINANKDEFQQIIESETGLVLVDFWAEWCGPCKMLGPILEDITEEVEDVTVLKINVDNGDNASLSAEFGVRGIPTVIVFRDGEQVDKFVGLRQKAEIMSVIEKNTESKADESED